MTELIKELWDQIETNSVNTSKYDTDVNVWLCQCDKQKYNQKIFPCKHILKKAIDQLDGGTLQVPFFNCSLSINDKALYLSEIIFNKNYIPVISNGGQYIDYNISQNTNTDEEDEAEDQLFALDEEDANLLNREDFRDDMANLKHLISQSEVWSNNVMDTALKHKCSMLVKHLYSLCVNQLLLGSITVKIEWMEPILIPHLWDSPVQLRIGLAGKYMIQMMFLT